MNVYRNSRTSELLWFSYTQSFSNKTTRRYVKKGNNNLKQQKNFRLLTTLWTPLNSQYIHSYRAAFIFLIFSYEHGKQFAGQLIKCQKTPISAVWHQHAPFKIHLLLLLLMQIHSQCLVLPHVNCRKNTYCSLHIFCRPPSSYESLHISKLDSSSLTEGRKEKWTTTKGKVNFLTKPHQTFLSPNLTSESWRHLLASQ